MLDVDKLLELEAKATPEKWIPRQGSSIDHGYYFFRYATGPHIDYMKLDNLGTFECANECAKLNEQVRLDSELIAEMRNSIRQLCLEVKALREVEKAARQLSCSESRDYREGDYMDTVGHDKLTASLKQLDEARKEIE